MTHHPAVSAAASGCLPEWAKVEPARRAHVERVAALMGAWTKELGLAEHESQRWLAAAFLHDALRDAPPAALRQLLPEADDVPDALLHGPAVSRRLRSVGVDDEELLSAVAHHTTGDPDFGPLGRALYAADFLEPGRTFMQDRRAELRARAPEELDAVVYEVARERIRDQVARGVALHPRTVAFWNALVASRE